MKRGPSRVLLLASVVILSGCAGAPRESWWGEDKLKHLGVATALSATATYAAVEAGQDGEEAQVRGIGVVLVLGAAKEGYDSGQANNRWSWKDMAWNVVGALVGSSLVRALHAEDE